MKRIITSACLILTFVFGLSAFAQAQRRNVPRSQSGKHKTANHPPKINSFKPDFETAIIACPTARTGDCAPPGRLTIKLMINAADPDGDNLHYEYAVTGGRIIGEGSSVTWDFTGVSPGLYTASVEVKDSHGSAAIASTD